MTSFNPSKCKITLSKHGTLRIVTEIIILYLIYF